MRSESNTERSRASVLKLLYDVTHEFGSTLELPAVLGKVLSLTVQSLGAETGSLFMLDGHGQVIRHILARQDLPIEVRDQVVATVMTRGLAGWVFLHRSGALVQDTETDERWHTFADDRQDIRSALAAPLVRRGALNGILTLVHSRPNAFTQDDFQLLTAIAQQAAAAIENARLFTQLSSERDTVEAVLNGVRDAILAVDSKSGRLTMINPSAARLLGTSPADAIGRPLAEVSPTSELTTLVSQVKPGKISKAEISIPSKGYFDVTAQVIPRVGKVAVLYDVTTFHELDAMKSEFVATVSHDLKNPLGTILGYSWLLEEEPNLSAEQQSFVKAIRESVERMQLLVGNLLDLAKIEAGVDLEREPCMLSEIVAAVWHEHVGAAAAKDIVFEKRVQPEMPTLVANKLRVTQALSNLVSNAIKYTLPHGHVTIEASATADTALLRVVDDGPGISAEDQSRLFQKFSRVGSAEMQMVHGTGLGLAIVASVVESHGGRVWVESEPGRGSSFCIELPL